MSRDPARFPMPTGREEEWRFTPLARLAGLLDASPYDGDVDLIAAGPVALDVVPSTDRRVGALLVPDERAVALALAGAGSARVLTIRPGAVAAAPVVLTSVTPAGRWTSALVVDVGAQAAVTVVIDRTGVGALSASTELRLGAAANVTLVTVYDGESTAVVTETQAIEVGRDAQLRHVVVTLGGDLVRLAPTVRFAGPGGDVDLVGLAITGPGQHHEHRLFVDHQAPHCRSRVTYKGALHGNDAHAVWIGDVLIGASATGTDTYESNRNLVLTDGARADSVPNLEIQTGEVAGAGHAVATGRFDEEALFYLQSRGIRPAEARRLVVRGFLADVAARIPVTDLRERVLTRVDAELDAVGSDTTKGSG